jgi:hypothetical protein
MIFTKDSLRPQPSYPTYPPYHQGDYLEDYFYKRFVEDNPKVDRHYIAVSWTTLYVENRTYELEKFINELDPNLSYFTVLQHDEAPKHKLPDDTICFSASQSKYNPYLKNLVQIPVSCSKLPFIPQNKKDIFCSFVGSHTHDVRIVLQNLYSHMSDYYFSQQAWTPSVAGDRLNHFIDIASRSKFTLCPRGYGNTSFRMYEAMQLGSVPVYVSDDHNLPWSDELNWNDFCVIVNFNNLQNIDTILKSINEERYHKMLENISNIYENYFTLDGMYTNIVKRISNEKNITSNS